LNGNLNIGVVMNDSKYIVLYSDEFKIDVWSKYMDILGLPRTETEVKLVIKDVIKVDK
jgi:hypothetical protein